MYHIFIRLLHIWPILCVWNLLVLPEKFIKLLPFLGGKLAVHVGVVVNPIFHFHNQSGSFWVFKNSMPGMNPQSAHVLSFLS